MTWSRKQPLGLTLRPDRVHCTRLQLIVALIFAIFLGLIARIFTIQVLGHGEKERTLKKIITSYHRNIGRRGDIRTADGTIIAREVIEYTVALDPTRIEEESIPRITDLICRGLGMADEERRAIHSRIQERTALSRASSKVPSLQFAVFRRGVSEGLVGEIGMAAERILSPKELRGLIFQPMHQRQYPRGDLLGPVVGATMPGFEGTDLIGIAGLELALESTLAGRDGFRKLRCEGRRIDHWYSPGEVDIHPIDGYNAILTIDSRIQGIAEEELERGLERENAAAGTAIVMDCRSGDILAMVNLPSLDPNHYHDYPAQEFDERRRNRAIESQFEPGSTIKPFIAAVALEKKLFHPDQQVWGGGKQCIFLNRRKVEDVHDNGPITFAGAVIYSSNIGMTHIGLRLGRDGLMEVLDRFHFQKRTGLGLPGEALGKRTQRNKWSEAYTSVSVSYGYELMVTPIQLCVAFSSLVNGGRLYVPRIVDRLEREEEAIPYPRAVEAGRPIEEDTSRMIREILVQVVEKGTAKGLRIPGFPFGGKTGTRISAGRNGPLNKDCLSSFLGFAPADDPQVTVLIMVERPKVHHYGSVVAGPVAAEILKRIFRIRPELAAETRLR